jgi:hypothetical protein
VVHLVPEWVRQAWAVPGLAAERRRVWWGGSPNSNSPSGNGSAGTGNPSLNAVGVGVGVPTPSPVRNGWWYRAKALEQPKHPIRHAESCQGRCRRGAILADRTNLDKVAITDKSSWGRRVHADDATCRRTARPLEARPDLHRWLRLIDPRYLGRRLTATMTGGRSSTSTSRSNRPL